MSISSETRTTFHTSGCKDNLVQAKTPRSATMITGNLK